MLNFWKIILMKQKLYLSIALLGSCFFDNSLKAQLGKEYRDTLLAGISANQVQIIFVDTFNTNSFDFTGSPRDVSKWTKSNLSGTPTNPTINTTNTWYTVGSYSNRGYEWGIQAFVRQPLNGNQGVYLWTPVINFPDIPNLYLKFILRCTGFSHSLTSNFTLGWVYDGNNDQSPDAPSGYNTVFQTTPTTINPYNDYTSGNFFPNTMMNARTVFMDISSLRYLSGRIGIRLSQTSSVTNNFDIDWVVVGSRPNNDLCQDAIQLAEGYNGGTRGYYNSVATGLTPCTNSSPRDRQGGAVIYVGDTPNGIGAIPTDGTYKDGYEPLNPGPLGSISSTIENSIWFKFITPRAIDCATGNLSVRITPRNMSCASNATATPRQVQFRVFNNAVCGSNTNHATVAITSAHDLVNNTPVTTGTLSYNTTYYVLIDGYNASDCQFRLQVETLLDGVVQTSPCVVQSPVVLPVDFHTLQVKCNPTQTQLYWKIEEESASPLVLERSHDGFKWNFFTELPKNQTYINVPTYQSLYRLSYIAYSGEVKYSNIVEANCHSILESLEVYPNPVEDYFQVQNLPIDAQIQLFDSKGTLIFEKMTTKSEEIIDISPCSSQIYLLNVYYNGENKTLKILKK